MKTVKLPAASLLGRLPLPGKKKEELSPSGPSEPAAPQDGPEKRRRRRKKKAWIKIVIVLLIVAAILIVVMVQRSRAAAAAAAEAASAVNTASVERRNVTSELSSTGTLEAADSYSIVSLVEGDVVSANFEEGDQVEKGQVLY